VDIPAIASLLSAMANFMETILSLEECFETSSLHSRKVILMEDRCWNVEIRIYVIIIVAVRLFVSTLRKEHRLNASGNEAQRYIGHNCIMSS
jgi:hypothetical protein